MITIKIMYADHCTLNTVSGCTFNELTSSSPPAEPQPAALTRYTIRLARVTLTPALPAAISLSRTAVNANPSRLRMSR
ncbi:MAG: hypothetical protein QOE03_3739 [Micromonosporaceae bacterium]|jgi:hypothetical protein|nr:hypothetical protein [Micromonosporaceae bacterium]